MNNKRNEQELTKRIYETDGFASEFEARVIELRECDASKYGESVIGLVLDETAFFPEGGGQQCDEGTIDDNNVIDVQIDSDGAIVHYIKCKDAYQPGQTVKGLVDMSVRFPRMQNHSAEHIVSGLVNSKFGYENVGFHMSKESVRFDFNGAITKEDMLEIEKAANEYVYKNIAINVYFPSEEELADLEYRSKLDLAQGVRLVEIPGADMCACCAPHVATTGQIGIIKIIDVMPHRQGTRVTMVAGINALDDYNMLHEDNLRIMALLSSKRDTTADFTKELLDRNTKLKEENTALKKEIASVESKKVLDRLAGRTLEDKSPEVVFSNVLDNVGMRNLINEAAKVYGGIVAGFIGDDDSGYRYILGTAKEDDNDIIRLSKALNEKFGGKGGGNKQMVQGSLSGNRKDIENLVKNF